MGHKHTKEEILAGALASSLDDGLSQLTFGRLAKRLGISDRVVVYYFPTKADLISEVILALGAQLQETLATAFTRQATDHLELAKIAWPALDNAQANAVFALFFEANGLAAAGREPYVSLVGTLIEMFIAWAAEFVDAPSDAARSEAEAAIAVLDGLLLLRLLAGPEAATRAARVLGVA